MMMASTLESTGMLLAILTLLVAVPLTVITFYLRSLREHQATWQVELIRRVEAVEASAIDLRKSLFALERDYTTKEEWLRECMLARQTLAQLTEASVRIETALKGVPVCDRHLTTIEAAPPSPVVADQRDVYQAPTASQGNP